MTTRLLQGTASAPGQERALIGRLINLVDALAARCDELATRVDQLDQLIEELVIVTSEDLIRLNAAGLRGEEPREQ
jgi:hypothetical protein